MNGPTGSISAFTLVALVEWHLVGGCIVLIGPHQRRTVAGVTLPPKERVLITRRVVCGVLLGFIAGGSPCFRFSAGCLPRRSISKGVGHTTM